ncbi:MAG: hypothetical protein COU27_01540 [Candidatus Levybacteria bacterium CG10_big_fil_rev_8_21_14_0_10_36_7]|nr:MAG: hypothetical protein COU27_01540 [Candidatus Levybacteria bacterium CG10_big_fil_rev_8_21_14_0_10_36_7]
MEKRKVMYYAGNFLIGMAVLGLVLTFGQSLYFEAAYKINQLKGISYGVANTSPLGEILKISRDEQEKSESLLSKVLENNTEKILIPPSTDFSIVIPKIGASEKITANVDPANKKEYLKVLQESIAHAKGSAFPGLNGTTYLFAHSADNFWNVGRYNAVFYLIGKLENDDDIYVFSQGKRYNYKVYDKKIVDPSDVEYISSNIGGGDRLILQTCWPPGTTWKRELVFGKLKSQ